MPSPAAAGKEPFEHAALAQWLTQQLLLVRGGARARLATADGALGAGGGVSDAAAADPTAADAAAARAYQIE